MVAEPRNEAHDVSGSAGVEKVSPKYVAIRVGVERVYAARVGPGRRPSLSTSAVALAGFVVAVIVAAIMFVEAHSKAARYEGVVRRSSVGPGPVRVRGTLGGTATRKAPSGRLGAGYAGWIRARVRRNTVTLCTAAELEGLEIRTDRGTLRLAGAPMERTWVLDDELYTPRGKAEFIVGVRERPPEIKPIPTAITRDCSSAVSKDDATYHELVLSPGDAVEIFACREGDTLRPCWDGVDAIALGTADGVLAGMAQDGNVEVVIGSVVGLVGVIGSLMWALRLRAALRPREDERPLA